MNQTNIEQSERTSENAASAPPAERIGVYVCHCGTNIAGTVDVGAVAEFARGLPDVAVVREYKYMCSDPGQDLIKNDIKEDKLTRVVVSSCSPLMHENTFRDACEDAGLNRFLFQMSNIREQCSWVHEDRKQATDKAKRLVAAAVRRVRQHKPLEQREVPVRPETVVVGAGIAGIEAALRIADSGKKVYLVEKEPSIGGHMAKFDKTFPTLDCAACILTPKMVSVGQHPSIDLLSYSEVEDVGGYVGNFKVKVRRKARYIDEDKCTGCGQCVTRCPVQFKPRNGNIRRFRPVQIKPELKGAIDRAIVEHHQERAPLISVLQDINIEFRHLPPEGLHYISKQLDVPLSRVYHVATFYTAFTLVPRGEHTIKVCMGTSCHIKGAQQILEMIRDRLEIDPGQTTDDKLFSLETVNCLGACAISPVVVVDSKYYGNMSVSRVDKMLEEYK